MLKILSDTYSSSKLKSELEAVGNLNFKLVSEEGKKTRSIEDPTVLAAVIGAGATTLGAVIGLIGVWLSTRNNKADVVIEIKMTKEIAQILLAEKVKENLTEKIAERFFASNIDSLILSAEDVKGLSEKDQLFFDTIPESEVDYLSILEDL